MFTIGDLVSQAISGFRKTLPTQQNGDGLDLPVFTLLTVVSVAYCSYVLSLRWKQERILSADRPAVKTIEEAHTIYSNLVYFDFPSIGTKALEFGLFRTYGIPSISKILVSTNELVDNCGRRYDDTDLLVREFVENMPGTERANLAIRRMNALHAKYAISNEDYIYVLCIFAVEPIRWIDRFGYRRTFPVEKESAHIFWNDVGTKMGIQNIPRSYQQMELYLDDFEEKYMKYNKNNVLLAESTTKLLLSKIPSFLQPLGRRAVHALCDKRLRSAMGFPDPLPGLPCMLQGVLLLNGFVTRMFLLPRSVPVLRTPRCPMNEKRNFGDSLPRYLPLFHPYESTYASGYIIEQLGPEKFAKSCELGPLHSSSIPVSTPPK